MPHLARHLAIAACLTLLGSAADTDAAPKRAGKVVKAKKQVAPVEETDEEEATDEEDGEDDTADEEEKPKAKAKASKRKQETRKRAKTRKKSSDTKVGLVDEIDSAELVDTPKVKRTAKRRRNWNFAIGPNVWMASVDANVAVGAKTISTAVDFFDLQRNTKLGVPVLVEARYKRFSFVGDVLYGVIGIKGGNDVGPLMVTLDGTVKNLSVDGIAGYRVVGKDDSAKVSLDARAGIRYQRMEISGSAGVSGNGLTLPSIVDGGADALVGARVFLRPSRWFFVTGTVDQSLFGSSTSTWSAGADANLRIGSRALVGAGWRTLTQQKEAISTVMHGPKVTLQLVF